MTTTTDLIVTQEHTTTSLATAIPDAWLAGQLRPRSLIVYKHDVGAYCRWCAQENSAALEPKSLALWRDHLVTDTQMSPKTINRMLSAVKTFVQEGAKPEREIFTPELALLFGGVSGVSEKALKHRMKLGTRYLISKDDMRGLCEMPDRSRLKGKRDAALLATLASSGMRNSELCALQIGDVSFHDGGYFLTIRGGGKGHVADREAYLSEEAYLLIKEWLEARRLAHVESAWIFTSFATRAAFPSHEPIHDVGVRYVVKQYVQKYARQTNNPALAQMTVHSFRRAVGTYLYRQAGIEAAFEALGHADPKTTVRAYVLGHLYRPGLTDHLYDKEKGAVAQG